MAKKSKSPSPFEGRWRIVLMSAWDEEYIDEEEEGFFEFDEKGSGDFHFGYVQGHMDCRLTTRDGVPAVEWTWDGNDEMDPAQGGCGTAGAGAGGQSLGGSAGSDREVAEWAQGQRRPDGTGRKGRPGAGVRRVARGEEVPGRIREGRSGRATARGGQCGTQEARLGQKMIDS